MNTLIALHNGVFERIDRALGFLLPTLARFTFAAVLLVYYWSSALTKVGPGLLGLLRPSDGAYVQIFPKAMEAVSYDVGQLGMMHWLVVLAGMWAEFLLPLLVVIGLFGRLAALGMIGFVCVQSTTDVTGHGMTDAATLGAWFDRFPDSVILDQRLLWITVLAFIVVKGAGPLSVDRLLGRLS